MSGRLPSLLRLLIAPVVVLAACPPAQDPVAVNDAGDEAFVKRLVPLMWGRAPGSVREVQVLRDLVVASDRETVVRAMARSPEYLDRWHDSLMDMTGTSRTYIRANQGCYDASGLGEDSPEPAAFVRDNPPRSDFGRPFTMYDLGRSALLLDDLSPWFEADLFANIVFDGAAMNVIESEAVRTNTAELFQRNYLNREMTCLPCHNSIESVTGHVDPELDRTWEVPGRFEEALYSVSSGIAMNRLHGFFRRDGVVVGPTTGTDEEDPPPFDPEVVTPWGGAAICGEWAAPEDVLEDRLELPAYFIEEVGTYASMWDLEPKLAEGLRALAGQGLAGGEGVSPSGPESFATLLALSVAEKVWAEAMGFELTLGHGFPRNEAQRDLLVHLAETWVQGNYSLVDVLVEVALHPYFVQRAPVDLLDTDTAYYYDPIFDPFTVEDQDPDRHGNSSGDLLRRGAARGVLRAAYSALQWAHLPDFPDPDVPLGPDNGLLTYQDDAWIQQVLGLKMKDSASGFRSLDFQTLLTWQGWFGDCTNPLGGGEPDWIDLALAHAADEGATVGELVSAMKDRLLTDPDLDDPDERRLLQAVLGGSLDLAVPPDLPDDFARSVRLVCGVWLSSPQFQLSGDPGPDRIDQPPTLVVPGSSYRDFCEAAKDSMFGGDGLRCGAGSLELP